VFVRESLLARASRGIPIPLLHSAVPRSLFPVPPRRSPFSPRLTADSQSHTASLPSCPSCPLWSKAQPSIPTRPSIRTTTLFLRVLGVLRGERERYLPPESAPTRHSPLIARYSVAPSSPRSPTRVILSTWERLFAIRPSPTPSRFHLLAFAGFHAPCPATPPSRQSSTRYSSLATRLWPSPSSHRSAPSQRPYIQGAQLGRARNVILITFGQNATDRARSPLIPQSLTPLVPTSRIMPAETSAFRLRADFPTFARRASQASRPHRRPRVRFVASSTCSRPFAARHFLAAVPRSLLPVPADPTPRYSPLSTPAPVCRMTHGGTR